MNFDCYVLSQILDLVHRQTLDRFVQRFDAESRIRHFGCLGSNSFATLRHVCVDRDEVASIPNGRSALALLREPVECSLVNNVMPPLEEGDPGVAN